jgi:Putative peptidoglycan binding domain
MNSGPTLSIGSTGPDVRRLQIIFVMTKVLDVSDIDSNFGPKTRDAVKSFQQGNNLTPDGVVGPLTWQALPADPNTPRLARGSTGPANRSWTNRWELWSENRISRACLSNAAKCWRSDVVGSCRSSWRHSGEVSGPCHSLSWVAQAKKGIALQ